MSIKNYNPNLYKILLPQMKVEKGMFMLLLFIPFVLFAVLYFTLDTAGEIFPFNDIFFVVLFAVGIMQIGLIPLVQKKCFQKVG